MRQTNEVGNEIDYEKQPLLYCKQRMLLKFIKYRLNLGYKSGQAERPKQKRHSASAVDWVGLGSVSTKML